MNTTNEWIEIEASKLSDDEKRKYLFSECEFNIGPNDEIIGYNRETDYFILKLRGIAFQICKIRNPDYKELENDSK